jgi:amino acid transporter
MSATGNTENLKREIGARSLAIAGVNVMVGTGIFVLPALVAEGLGAAAILAYIFCGALVFLIALCFAELGSKTTESGGPYKYIERSLGPFAGFLAGNLYLLGSIASDAALANALTDTLQLFFPDLRVELYRLLFQFIIFAGLAWLNIRSVKNGVRFVLFTGIGKLIPLVLLVLFAIPHVQTENLAWTIQPNINNIGSASLLLFFAFLGLEVSLCNGGEIKNPKRNVPLGLFGSIIIVLILYAGIQLATQGVLGSNLSESKEAPLAALANNIWGPTGMTIIIAVTALSILGSLSSEILSIPRIMFAAARNGLMPAMLGKVHIRFATPYVAIIIYAAIDFIMAASGTFKQLAIIASISLLLVYLGVAFALIKSRRRPQQRDGGSFRVPGGIIVPVLAIGAIAWLLFHSQKTEVIAISIAIAILSIIYFLMITINANRNIIKKTIP